MATSFYTIFSIDKNNDYRKIIKCISNVFRENIYPLVTN